MRLQPVDPSDFDEHQRELFGELSMRPEVQRSGLVGPFGVWMHAPKMGSAMARLGAEIRFGASLPANVTEVAICTTGVFFRSSFEFAAHRRMAVAAGVDPARLDALAAGDEPGFEGDEAVAHRAATELLDDHALTDDTFVELTRRWGSTGAVELVTTVGYYSLISLTLNGFDVELAPGMDDPF